MAKLALTFNNNESSDDIPSLRPSGRDEGQLWYPRKVAVIRTSGRYVVCDRGSERSRMQLFTRNGQFIKKIAIRYIDIVAGLAITSQGG